MGIRFSAQGAGAAGKGLKQAKRECGHEQLLWFPGGKVYQARAVQPKPNLF